MPNHICPLAIQVAFLVSAVVICISIAERLISKLNEFTQTPPGGDAKVSLKVI